VKIPGIIDNGVWQRAQNVVQKSRRVTASQNGKGEYLLSSILKCEACGCFLNGKRVKSGKKDYRYYICPNRNNRKGNKSCHLSLINSEELERKIWGLAEKHILENIQPGLDFIGIAEKTSKNVQNCIEQLSDELEKSRAESDRLVTLYQKGFIDEEEMCCRLDKLSDKQKMLGNKLEHKNAMAAKAHNELDKIINSKNIYNNIEDILKKVDKKDQKHILRSLISEILVGDDYLLIKGSI
jgi:site-specific DNA recombinase